MTFPVTGSWYTPAEIVDAARAVMDSIDLDPASCPEANEVIRATHIFTREDDGLAQDWFGHVWLNSPTDTISRFASKLLGEYGLGRIVQAVMFTHNETQADWHQNLSNEASGFCMPEGRITHWRPTGNGGTEYFTPPWGQSIFCFGSASKRFKHEFEKFGTVWVR